MTIADLFVKVDPYDPAAAAAGGTTDGDAAAAAAPPRTVEERKAQMVARALPAYTNVRLPGALLATHYAIHCAHKCICASCEASFGNQRSRRDSDQKLRCPECNQKIDGFLQGRTPP